MQMLFTWNTENLCIVFRWWHIRSTFGLVASLLAVVALVAGYEALREGIRRYETWANKRAETAPRKFAPPTNHTIASHCIIWLRTHLPICGLTALLCHALPPSPSTYVSAAARKPTAKNVTPFENPNPLLSQLPCGGQGKTRSPSPIERTLSSRYCTGCRTFMLS